MEGETRPYLPEDRLQSLQGALQYVFKDAAYLSMALVHSSAKEEGLRCNERMEFLGDAVLGMIVSDHLYATHPEFEEGDLSSIKSVVVSCQSLAQRAREIGLGDFILLGKGITQRKVIPESVLCNTFEALVAAIYLDGGVEPVRTFVLRMLMPAVAEVLANKHERNYKSILQHYTQKELSSVPVYRVVKETGPDHEKSFGVVVAVNGEEYGPGAGRTKKDAEQQAAKLALVSLGLLEPSTPVAGPE